MSFLDKHTYNEIASGIASSTNLADVLFKLDKTINSTTNRMVLTQYIKDHDIDISHFKKHDRLTDEEVFSEHSHAGQRALKKRYKDGNYTEYKCSICGQEPFWNDKELILILDHINGVHDDDRLENLRWVCPNCNRQLETSNGKNAKREIKEKEVHHCVECGSVVSQKGCLCNICAGIAQRRVERPPALELARMIKESSFLAVGKQYGVSDNAIRKWCKIYGIPIIIKELVAWYNKQMGIVEIPPEPKPKGVFTQPNPVKQIDPQTKAVIRIFPSQTAACEYFGGKSISSISEVCRGLRKTAYDYEWAFV